MTKRQLAERIAATDAWLEDCERQRLELERARLVEPRPQRPFNYGVRRQFLGGFDRMEHGGRDRAR